MNFLIFPHICNLEYPINFLHNNVKKVVISVENHTKKLSIFLDSLSVLIGRHISQKKLCSLLLYCNIRSYTIVRASNIEIPFDHKI